jgi:hypothetical protein
MPSKQSTKKRTQDTTDTMSDKDYTEDSTRELLNSLSRYIEEIYL